MSFKKFSERVINKFLGFTAEDAIFDIIFQAKRKGARSVVMSAESINYSVKDFNAAIVKLTSRPGVKYTVLENGKVKLSF